MKHMTREEIDKSIARAAIAESAGMSPDRYRMLRELIDQNTGLVERIEQAKWEEPHTTIPYDVEDRVKNGASHAVSILLPSLLYIELMLAVRDELYGR